MGYTHITKEQRYRIQVRLEINMSQKDMAERLGKDKSAISREVRRNKTGHTQIMVPFVRRQI